MLADVSDERSASIFRQKNKPFDKKVLQLEAVFTAAPLLTTVSLSSMLGLLFFP
jgi:hypothetical protein